MSDDPYLYVRQARPDLYQEIVAFSSTVNLKDELQARASIEKFCMHLVDACKYALAIIIVFLPLLFTGVVEAGEPTRAGIPLNGSAPDINWGVINTYSPKDVKPGGSVHVVSKAKCSTPCEVRMRKAMQWMDEWVNRFPLFTMGDAEGEEAYRSIMVPENEFRGSYWREVMKECVQ